MLGYSDKPGLQRHRTDRVDLAAHTLAAPNLADVLALDAHLDHQ